MSPDLRSELGTKRIALRVDEAVRNTLFDLSLFAGVQIHENEHPIAVLELDSTLIAPTVLLARFADGAL